MSITATERTQIVTLTTLMFNAAPGATYLSQIVALYEANGHNLATLASQLAQTSVYQSMNPSFQTSAEFAASFLTPLGLAGDAFAVNFITSQLNAGASKAQVVYAAYQALANLDPNASAQYQAAKAVMTNKGTVAEYYSATLLGAATDLATLQTVVGSVTADPASVTSTEANLNNQVISGVTFNLTAGVDTINGTSGNDTINGVTGGASPTFTALDTINGGTGTNTLNINDVGTLGAFAMPAGASVSSIQVFNLNSAESVGTAITPFDVSSNAAVTTLAVSSIGNDYIKAGAAQNVTVSDQTVGGSTVSVTGGNNVTISATASTGGGAVVANGTAGALSITQNTGGPVTVGGTTAVAGTVAVTDTNLQLGAIAIDGGTNVTVTASTKTTYNDAANGGAAGAITIGATTKPTGTVNVTENLNGTGAASAGAITVNGGTTDNITVNMTQATGGVSTTAGAVNVNGSTATTAVSVTETKAVAAVAPVTAVAGVTESGSAVFTALTAGQSLTVGTLTFTAGAAGTTAAQTAAAFANLTSGALQGNSTLGTYTGGPLAGWTSGAVSGTSTVVFTSTTASSNVADLAFGGTGTLPTITETQGAAATKAVVGVGGIIDSAVTIVDAKYGSGTANSIASVALNGYATGSTISSDALSTLLLANALDAAVTVKDNTATALNLTLNNVTATNAGALSTLTIDAGAVKYTTLNVTTATADSALAITGNGVTALTIAGTNAVDLTGSAFGALKTVAVSGSAGATLASVASVTDINASATSGNMTVTAFDATKATYEGGSGSDAVTLSTANPSKAISLGAGNDTLTLFAGTTAPTATLDGGAGTDTLSMAAVDAANASTTSAFASKVVGFEQLTLTGTLAAADTIDLAALGGYSYVTDKITPAGFTTTLNNMASGGTLVLSGTGGGALDVVNVTNAATGTADVLNILVSNKGATTAGSVTAAGVETVNITATDTTKAVVAGTNTDTLTLVDTGANTIVVTGNATLNLTSANTKVSLVDASGMTGGLVYTAAGTVAETVKGGAAANTLTASVGTVADTLIGGAGNDTLKANGGLDTLTGGAGADKFVIQTPSANLNSYATITDASAGDTIQLSTTGAVTFVQSKVTLGATAVFQDYANAVVASVATAQGNIAWFQYGGDTYIVQHEAAGAETSFTNNTDIVVKLAGLVDLSHTSLNATSATLLIA